MIRAATHSISKVSVVCLNSFAAQGAFELTHSTLQGPQDEDEEPFQHFKGIHARWEKENSSRVASMQEELYGHMLLTPEELNIEVLRTADVRNTHDIEEAVGSEREGGVGDCHAAADGSASLLEGKQEDKKIGHSISEAEFLSVSNIVRGRCKREECNELLELLIVSASKAKKGRNGQIQPLTTAVLVRMGARVTGQTGGSRLATLRCLKRITISKEGLSLNPGW